MKFQFDSETQTVTVDGVAIALEVLLTLAHPDSNRVYRFSRSGVGVTIVHSYSTEEEAREARV